MCLSSRHTQNMQSKINEILRESGGIGRNGIKKKRIVKDCHKRSIKINVHRRHTVGNCEWTNGWTKGLDLIDRSSCHLRFFAISTTEDFEVPMMSVISEYLELSFLYALQLPFSVQFLSNSFYPFFNKRLNPKNEGMPSFFLVYFCFDSVQQVSRMIDFKSVLNFNTEKIAPHTNKWLKPTVSA